MVAQVVKTKRNSKTIKVFSLENCPLTRSGVKYTISKFTPKLDVTNEFSTGESIIEYLKIKTPDVILMDLDLPTLGGLETVKRIRELYPEIKIVILTKHSTKNDVLQAFSNGANAYCTKDISPETLAKIVEKVALGALYVDSTVAWAVSNKENKTEFCESEKLKKANILNEINLTQREKEVAKLLVKGMTNSEIAKELIITVHTAKAHVCSILNKLKVRDRVQAAVKAVHLGLVEYDVSWY